MQNVEIGQKVVVNIRAYGKDDDNFPIYRKVKAVVAGIYKHFIRLRCPAGYCECFSWREFQQIRED